MQHTQPTLSASPTTTAIIINASTNISHYIRVVAFCYCIIALMITAATQYTVADTDHCYITVIIYVKHYPL